RERPAKIVVSDPVPLQADEERGRVRQDEPRSRQPINVPEQSSHLAVSPPLTGRPPELKERLDFIQDDQRAGSPRCCCHEYDRLELAKPEFRIVSIRRPADVPWIECELLSSFA